MYVDVINRTEEIKNYCIKGAEVVVIDALRATTSMVTAFKNGAKKIITVMTPEEAYNLKKKEPNILLGGERGGIKIKGFDLGNSPLEYAPHKVNDKVLVISTTNGTRLIQNSLDAQAIYLGCFLNSFAVSKKLKGEKVFLACAGSKGNFAIEDFLAAGSIARNLELRKGAILSKRAKEAVQTFEALDKREELLELTPHGLLLIARGFERDIFYCSELDTTRVVPCYFCGSFYPIANRS